MNRPIVNNCQLVQLMLTLPCVERISWKFFSSLLQEISHVVYKYLHTCPQIRCSVTKNNIRKPDVHLLVSVSKKTSHDLCCFNVNVYKREIKSEVLVN